MARRPRYIILGAVLGLAAMPVIIALAWGLLLASGWVPVLSNGNGVEKTFPVAGLISFLVAVLVALFLVYQGYRLDQKEKLPRDKEEI
ncbi:MAG: hypothetical protein ACOYEK_09295 [bacterium]|jgi:cation transporter-like permease